MPYTQPAATGGASGSGVPVAVAGGAVDVITATFVPALTLADKTLCAIIALGANVTTTPTFAPNGLTAHVITKQGGAALVAGDIPGALAVCLFEYNLANTRWELLNPKADVTDATNVALAGALMKALLAMTTDTVVAGAVTVNFATTLNHELTLNDVAVTISVTDPGWAAPLMKIKITDHSAPVTITWQKTGGGGTFIWADLLPLSVTDGESGVIDLWVWRIAADTYHCGFVRMY